MAQHNITGATGEDVAVEFLVSHKYKLLARNFRTKVGEVDIIARDGIQYVFVEVKTRSSSRFGTPSEAITPKKLLSLIKTAEYYLLVNKLGQNFRIDAVEVIMRNSEVESINQIKNITF